MITYYILSCYNQLLATSLIYITMVDPIRDIASTLGGQAVGHPHVWVMASSSPDEQNYYETLGVEKSATKQEIHRAFRQLAKKYHPDKNKEKSATDEFIKIFKAYETLSDEKKRKEYDDYTTAHAGSWTTATPNNAYDFDINDFFKQYEDQYLKHAQQHQHQHPDHHHYQHNQYHHDMHNHMHQDHFKFHGINLDELFNDVDEDEFSSFGRWFDGSNLNHNHHYHQQSVDGHFGDGASFFGSHFGSELHDTLHRYPQQQVRYHDGSNHAGYSCQTTTRHVNGMVVTQTSCS